MDGQEREPSASSRAGVFGHLPVGGRWLQGEREGGLGAAMQRGMQPSRVEGLCSAP